MQSNIYVWFMYEKVNYICIIDDLERMSEINLMIDEYYFNYIY